MTRALLCSLAAFVIAAPAAAGDVAYHAPKNGFGQPDLTGAWSNVTLTPQVRPSLYGTRKVQTPEEVRLLEGANAAKDAAGKAPIDLKAEGGASDNVGAYDRNWVDNGAGVMRVGGEPRTSLITTEDGQPPPTKGQPKRALPPGAGSREAGLRAVKEAADVDMFERQGSVEAAKFGSYDNPEGRGLGERCLLGFSRSAGPPMFPNGWYNNNYLLTQGRNEVVIVVEMVHDARIVRLNARHRTDDVRPWMGDSIGWYDGDTLVVETDHIPQAQAYFGSWRDLTVTERFTRVAGNRLRYQFTVKDPTMWDQPWGGEYEFHPLNGQVFEYACHEGNYALRGILSGAREAEKRAASGAERPTGGN
jgi:hypothetical protein